MQPHILLRELSHLLAQEPMPLGQCRHPLHADVTLPSSIPPLHSEKDFTLSRDVLLQFGPASTLRFEDHAEHRGTGVADTEGEALIHCAPSFATGIPAPTQ